MMKLILTFLCSVFLICSAFADGQPDYIQKWKNSEKDIETDPASRDKFFESFSQPASSEEIEAATSFLIDRIGDGVTDIGYYVTFGKLSWAVGDHNANISKVNSSAIVSAAAILIVETDLARCKNKEAGTKVYIDTVKTLKEPLHYLQIANEMTRKQILVEAMKFENKIQDRPVDPLICLPETDSKQIEHISDADWQKARLKIRTGFESSLFPKQ